MQKLHHLKQISELNNPVGLIFNRNSKLGWYFEFFCGTFQGNSYWLKTLQQESQAEKFSCLASLEWKVSQASQAEDISGILKFSGKPGRISLLPGLPGEFLANKKCLEKVLPKILKISWIRQWRWKWQLQTWLSLSPLPGRLLFQILEFFDLQPFLAVSASP